MKRGELRIRRAESEEYVYELGLNGRIRVTTPTGWSGGLGVTRIRVGWRTIRTTPPIPGVDARQGPRAPLRASRTPHR